MDVIRKDATIVNTDDAFPGSFEVILSAPTKDRDGDTLLAEQWKQPLPDHITFDRDHEMSVKGTVGSGKPRIDEEGRLIVAGTYSSLPHAQETRTLVKEGHIRTTSVAFMTEKTQKDGRSTVVRELLNGAFVAVPSNREALVLSAKSVEAVAKAGRRNSASDQAHLDAIAVHAIALGAQVRSGGDTDADEDVAAAKSVARATVKTVAGSYEQAQQAINDALSAAYPDSGDDRWVYAYPTATFPGTVVYRVSGNTDQVGQWQADYMINDDGTVTLGTPSRVNLVEQIVPVDGDSNENGSAPAAISSAAAGEKTVDKDALEMQAARARLLSTLTS